MLSKLKHYVGLSFWKRLHRHCSFPNAPPGCVSTANASLNVGKVDTGVTSGKWGIFESPATGHCILEDNVNGKSSVLDS